MKGSIRPYALLFVTLLFVCNYSTISQALVDGNSYISTYGRVTYSMVDLTVDYANQIVTNQLRLGTQFHAYSLWEWSPEQRDKARACKFGLIRVFTGDAAFEPCTYWDEATRTGTWDWSKLDAIIEAILGCGAEPLICIGGYDMYPHGMAVDTEKDLPVNFESFAQYCGDIVEHYKNKGLNFKYWEILNEAGRWRYSTETCQLFNLCAESMHAVDSSILIGNDRSSIPHFFDEFVANAQGMGFLSFHKYDSGRTTAYNPPPDSDSQILENAGNLNKNYNDPDVYYYSPSEMKQKWFEARGEYLPIICSETNLNWAWEGGTDPRIQQIFGAVWYAEELRAFIIDNAVEHSIYYGFASHTWPHWTTGGKGFCMISCHAPYEEFYPYWLHLLLADKLNVDDPIFEATSSNSTAVSVLAWENDNCYNILVVGKTRNAITVNIQVMNVDVENITVISAYTIGRNSGLRIKNMSYSDPISIHLDGYSVVLLRVPERS